MPVLVFLRLVLELLLKYGGSVTSWVRSVDHNASVGGEATSQHLAGLAVDAVFGDPGAREAFVKEAAAAGLHLLEEADHVHVQALPKGVKPPGV